MRQPSLSAMASAVLASIAVSAPAAAAAFATTIAGGAAGREQLPSFEGYLKKFGLSFPPDELSMRRDLYSTAVAQIQVHNARPGRFWTAGVNELTALTEAEANQYLGNVKAPVDAYPAPMALQVGTNQAGQMPSNFDWRNRTPSVVTPVKGQGSCGSCWAIAASAVMESFIAIKTGLLFELSPQQITSCAPNPKKCGGQGGCQGATVELGFEYAIKAGMSSSWTYPYFSGTSHETGKCFGPPLNKPVAGISGYARVPSNDPDTLMRKLLDHPVKVSVGVVSSFRQYSEGVFDGCPDDAILNHAVILNGYGETKVPDGHQVFYWLVRNSWGPRWGEQGYMRIRRYPGAEPKGIDTDPLAGSGCPGGPPNITVYGECGLLTYPSYPTGAFLGAPADLEDPALRSSQVQLSNRAAAPTAPRRRFSLRRSASSSPTSSTSSSSSSISSP